MGLIDEKIVKHECKILWISSLPPKQSVALYQQKGYTDMAGFVSQWNYIEAIEKVTGKPVERISAVRIPSFPEYHNLFVKKEMSSHIDGVLDINVGFLNIEYLNLFFSQLNLVHEAKKWAKKNKGINALIIMESLSTRFLAAGIAIKKINKNVLLCNIVTDLPQFMNRGGMPIIKKILKTIDWRIIQNKMVEIDKFLLYTKHMASFLTLGPERWIVIEGMSNEGKLSTPIPKKYEGFVCTYAGNLINSMKIENFISAFQKANIPNSELLIFGAGDSKENIIRISKNDTRIKYCGYRPNNEVFEALMKSTLLVHPRPTADEYTKYSCPSKIFEYMSSGTAVIGTKLLGIPDEYYEHMFVFSGDSIEEMADSLDRVSRLTKEEIAKKGFEAREFLKREKSPQAQVEKLLHFLNYPHLEKNIE